MSKPLYLFVGESASGKTSVAEYLEKVKSMRSVQSYTTRPPRYEGEKGHRFISEEEFDKLENIVAYTEYNNNRYCSTQKQINDSDIYVIDPLGVETLLEKYKPYNREIYIIYFYANDGIRTSRMHKRGDSDKKILERLTTDAEYNWWNKLSSLYIQYKYDAQNPNKHLHLFDVDANNDFDKVITDVLNIMNLGV